MTELVLDAFVTAVIAASDYEEMDRIYLKNRVMSRVGEEGLDAPAHHGRLDCTQRSAGGDCGCE